MKLNKQIREQILNAVMVHAYPPLDDKINAIGMKLIDRIYTPELRAKMDELPAGAFPKYSSQNVKWGTEWHAVKLPEPMSFLYTHYVSAIALEDDDPLTIEYKSIQHDESVRLETKAKAAGIIWSVSTTEKLIEIWPEIAQFVPSEIPKTNLPAIRIEDLNKELKL